MSQTPTGTIDLCAIFLKLPPGTTDERVVLGLPPEASLTRDEVLGALRDRLKLVSEHPMAATPEAAEVRMLLHACVARLLLGPNAKALQDSAAQALAGSTSNADSHREVSRFEELALLTLAQHGGWTKQAVHHLQLVALSSGIPADQVAHAMADLAGQPWAGAGHEPRSHTLVTRGTVTGPRALLFQSEQATSQGSTTATPHRRPQKTPMTEEQRQAAVQAALEDFTIQHAEDPAKRMLRNAIIGGSVGLVSLVVVALGLKMMFKPSTNKPAGNTTPSTPAATNSGSPSAANNTPIGELANPGTDISKSVASPSTTPSQDVDKVETSTRPATELLAILRRCANDADRAPAAAASEFVATLEEMSVSWLNGSSSDVIAAADATAEFAYRAAGKSEALSPIVGHLHNELSLLTEKVDGSAWDARRIARATFACGVASRLLRERDLPTGVRVPLRRSLADALGGSMSSEQSTVQQTMTAALDHMATLMMRRSDAAAPIENPRMPLAMSQTFASWTAWARAGRAAANSTDESDQLILLALDRVMTKGKEPSEDPAIANAIESLSSQVSLAKDSPSRSAILRWLVAADVSPLDLRLLTTALVQRPESGLELTATLSSTATENDRQLLRERYANLWQVTEGTVHDELMSRWRERFAEMAKTTPGTSLQERVSYAVALSSLNTAAVEAMRGDVVAFSSLLDLTQRPLQEWSNGPKYFDSDPQTSWGVNYLAAGNDILKRKDILLVVQGLPSPMEARILVEEATRSGAPEIRREARNVLVRSLDNPAVIRAFLDFSAFIPATKENSRLIEAVARTTLPQPRSSTWRVEVRRALLRRLLEELSPNDNTHVDLAADRLLMDYRQRANSAVTQKEVEEGADLADASIDPKAQSNDEQSNAKPTAEPRPETLPVLAVVPRELLGAMRSYEAELTMQSQKGWLADPAFSSVQDVLSSRDARLLETQTDLQKSVVEINTVIELQARIVAFNNRSATDQVLAVLAAWRRDASNSYHVIEQLAAGELAQARLWMIRFGGQLDPSTPGGFLISPSATPPAGAANPPTPGPTAGS